MSKRMTIQQVSNELGVSTKTLRRWEEKGYFKPERQENTNIRLYHPYIVGYWKKMLNLDRALKNHLRLLSEVRKELEKHLATEPLSGESFPYLDIDAFSKANEAMEKWEKEYKKLFDEIIKYPNIMLKASDDVEEK